MHLTLYGASLTSKAFDPMIFMLSKSSNDRVDSVAVQRFLPIVRESSAGCLETATSFKFPKLMTDSF